MGEDIIKGWKFYIDGEEANTDVSTELELPDDVIDKARLDMFKSLLFNENEFSINVEAPAGADISTDENFDKESLDELLDTIDKLKHEQYQIMVQNVYNYIRKFYNSQSDMIEGLLRNRFIIAVPDDIIKNMLIEMFDVYNIDYSDKIQVHKFLDSVYIVDGDKLNGGRK